MLDESPGFVEQSEEIMNDLFNELPLYVDDNEENMTILTSMTSFEQHEDESYFDKC